MHEGEQHDHCYNVKSPPYSTNVSRAWEVVEKLCENAEVWRKFIECLPDKKDLFGKNKADASETLCRKALEAVKSN
jgi:hypothetical protein